MLNELFRKSVTLLTITSFLLSGGTIPVSAQTLLSRPGEMVALSPACHPPVIDGVKIHADEPFRFDFILDKGDAAGAGERSIKDESARLIKYFLAALTVPENDLWVNLSPYEKDRIVPETFGRTEMGRDLLAQDYFLKQLTASLMSPDGDLGKEFWRDVYKQAREKFGTSDIPVDTFNKVWIVPEKAVVYENGNTAYVVRSRLKVLLESDYLAASHGAASQTLPSAIQDDVKRSIRAIILPALEKEVNESWNFAQLRQVYHSLILATWYKQKFKESLLSKAYVDRKKVNGVNIVDPGETKQIWEQYVQAFQKGAYNFIREEKDPVSGDLIPKKYFSGGCSLKITDMSMTTDMAALPQDAALNDRVVVQANFKPIETVDASQPPEIIFIFPRSPAPLGERVGARYNIMPPTSMSRTHAYLKQKGIVSHFIDLNADPRPVDEILTPVITSNTAVISFHFSDIIEQSEIDLIYQVSHIIERKRSSLEGLSPLLTVGGRIASFMDQEMLEKISPLDFIMKKSASFNLIELMGRVRAKKRKEEKLDVVAGLSDVLYRDTSGNILPSEPSERRARPDYQDVVGAFTPGEINYASYWDQNDGPVAFRDDIFIRRLLRHPFIYGTCGVGCTYCSATKFGQDPLAFIGMDNLSTIIERTRNDRLLSTAHIIGGFDDDLLVKDWKNMVPFITSKFGPYHALYFNTTAQKISKLSQDEIDLLQRNAQWIVLLGMENPNQRILKEMRKLGANASDGTFQRFIDAPVKAKQAGFWPRATFMMFWPSIQDQELVNFMDVVSDYIKAGIQVVIYPYTQFRAGSELYQQFLDKKIAEEDITFMELKLQNGQKIRLPEFYLPKDRTIRKLASDVLDESVAVEGLRDIKAQYAKDLLPVSTQALFMFLKTIGLMKKMDGISIPREKLEELETKILNIINNVVQTSREQQPIYELVLKGVSRSNVLSEIIDLMKNAGKGAIGIQFEVLRWFLNVGSPKEYDYVKGLIERLDAEGVTIPFDVSKSIKIRSDIQRSADHAATPIPQLDKKILLDKHSGRIKFGLTPVVKLDLVLWMVRHGQTPGNVARVFQGSSDEPINQLNDLGKEQARIAAEKMVEALRDKIASGEEIIVIRSPLRRAEETSEFFLDMFLKAGGKVRVVDEPQIRLGAREINFGVYENKAESEFPPNDRYIKRYRYENDALIRPLNGESFIDHLIKAKAWLETLNDLFKGRTVIVFGHGTHSSALRVLLGDKKLEDETGYIDWRTERMLPNAQPALLTTENTAPAKTAHEKDPAMTEPGGIDLTHGTMKLKVSNTGNSVPFKLDPSMLEQLQNSTGLTPVITAILPLNDLRAFVNSR